MSLHRYLTLREVAGLIHVSPSWLYNHIGRLEREHGFPRAPQGFRSRRDEEAVRRWQEAQIAPPLRRAEPAPAAADLPDPAELERQRAELDRRAALLFAAE